MCARAMDMELKVKRKVQVWQVAMHFMLPYKHMHSLRTHTYNVVPVLFTI